MNITTLLLYNIFIFFLIMFAGFLLVKTGIMQSEQSRVISSIVLYLTMPCMIINAFQIDYDTKILKGMAIAFFSAVLSHVLMFLFVYLSKKICGFDPMEQVSIIYTNAGNLVIPLVSAVLGKKWVIYASAFMAVQLLLLFTHGITVICGEKKIQIKKIFSNINIIAIIIGFFLFFSKLRFPAILGDTVTSLGNLTGPLSMIVTGMLLANVSFKEMKQYRRLPIVIFTRLFVCPLLILVVFWILHLPSLHESGYRILLVSYLAVITPPASSVTQIAQVYGSDAKYAGILCVACTIGSIVSMPLMVLIYGMVF